MKETIFKKICRSFFVEWEITHKELIKLQYQEWERNIVGKKKSRPRNPPFLLYWLRLVFEFLHLLSISKWLAQTQKHEEMKKIMIFVLIVSLRFISWRGYQLSFLRLFIFGLSMLIFIVS